MRLLIVGTLGGQVTVAAKIALSKGAKVVQVDDIATAMNTLRSGQSADLVMIDVALDIATLVLGLKTERIHLPVVACGIGSDASAAVRAIKAGVVHVNTYGGPDITVPLGGMRQSGNGHDKSMHALDKYLDLKTAWIQL